MSGSGEADKENDSAWQRSHTKFTGKRNSEYFDPCQEAADRSLRCLRRNGGDRSMCMDFFDAYKECKKSWMDEMNKEKQRKKRESNSWF